MTGGHLGISQYARNRVFSFKKGRGTDPNAEGKPVSAVGVQQTRHMPGT
jgi:hypothetical protein